MFSLTVFEIFLSENRSVLRPVQRSPGSERVNKTREIFPSVTRVLSISLTTAATTASVERKCSEF